MLSYTNKGYFWIPTAVAIILSNNFDLLVGGSGVSVTITLTVQLSSSGAADPADGNRRAVSASLSDWEVIESEVSTSKKTPPVVKEKPKNKPTVSEGPKKDAIDVKKSPILPPSQMASLASVLQKGPVKVSLLHVCAKS